LDIRIPDTLDAWNAAGADYLPGLLGVRFSKVEADEVVATLEVRRALAAWNGYLHAGTVTSLADTCCGYGTVRGLPAGANGFTTLELKSNLIGTAREGIVVCTARPIHKGRTTQVWDAQVRRESDGAPIAHFRNTQLILWPKV
jgi:1,4-dihydroxy-2-naphthoyl-CoA hydrolase